MEFIVENEQQHERRKSTFRWIAISISNVCRHRFYYIVSHIYRLLLLLFVHSIKRCISASRA